MNDAGRVVIVGGGILGTMHAASARQRGHEVVHLEREADARGRQRPQLRAGLGQRPGRRASELDLPSAPASAGSRSPRDVPGVGFRPAGSLTVAATDAELSLMKAACALPDADQRGFELLDAGRDPRGQSGPPR